MYNHMKFKSTAWLRLPKKKRKNRLKYYQMVPIYS